MLYIEVGQTFPRNSMALVSPDPRKFGGSGRTVIMRGEGGAQLDFWEDFKASK